MKFKALVFACAMLGVVHNGKADSKLDQVLTYVKQNPAKAAQVTVGGLSFGAGVLFTVGITGAMYTTPKDRNLGTVAILGCTLSIAYSGFHTFNDVLDNKPKEALKGLVLKIKSELQKQKVNE
jgi:4-hydroxybenzoate polyprenyltransferase